MHCAGGEDRKMCYNITNAEIDIILNSHHQKVEYTFPEFICRHHISNENEAILSKL